MTLSRAEGWLVWGTLSLSAFVIVLFLWAEIREGLAPCLLCSYQRIPWYFTFVISLVAGGEILLRGIATSPRAQPSNVVSSYQSTPYGHYDGNGVGEVDALKTTHFLVGWALIASVAITMTIGALGAAYHGAVEMGWLSPPTSCRVLFFSSDAGDFAARARSLLTAEVVECQRASWRFMGISAAWANFILSVMTIIAMIGAGRFFSRTSFGTSSKQSDVLSTLSVAS